jgi:hypothetical protein
MSEMWARLKWPVVLSVAFAAGIAGLMVWIALDHNPQEAYCVYNAAKDACAIQLHEVAVISLSWFVPTFVVALITSVAIGAVARRLSRS